MNYELPFNKVTNPASYDQVSRLREFENFECDESNSQLMKRLDSDAAEEMIAALENGEEVTVK